MTRSLFLDPTALEISDRTTLRNEDQSGCRLFSYRQALNQTTRHLALALELILRPTVFIRLVFPLPQSPLIAMVNGVFSEGSVVVATRASEYVSNPKNDASSFSSSCRNLGALLFQSAQKSFRFTSPRFIKRVRPEF